MKTKLVTTIMITLFLASILAIVIPVKADPTEWHVYWPGPIQTAVDAASPGDTIIVHPGIYEETVIFRSDDYDLDLVGMDGAIIEDNPDGSLLYGIDLKGGTHDISISGFEIRDFNEKDDAGIAGWTNPGDPDFAPMHDITIHHNFIHDNWDGINIGAFVWATWSPPSWRHHHITIHHNVIEHNHYRGIDLWSVSESTIAHNEILDNGGDWNGNGIFDQAADDMNGNGVTDGDGVTLCYVDHLKVKHNKIHGSYEVGLSINQCTDSKFAHNDVSNNLNLGIALFAWGFPTTRNVLLHNNASDNLSSGISLYTGSDDNKVENNHCNNNGLHGIDVRSDSNTLLENHCDENAYSGIRLRTGSDNNMVKKNHCNQNVQYGIRVSGDYNTFEMNHAKNNVISNYLDEGSGNVWIKNK